MDINKFVNCLDLYEIDLYKGDASQKELFKNRLLCFNEIPESDHDFIEHVLEFSKEHFYFTYLMKKNAAAFKRILSLTELIEVLRKTYTDCEQLSKSIAEGTLEFAKFDHLIRLQNNSYIYKADRFNPNWKDHLSKLMKSDSIDCSLHEERFNQFEVYMRLTQIVNITLLLRDIREKNKFTGDFAFLEANTGSLNTNIYKNKLLRDLDKKAIDTYTKLEKFGDADFVRCLEM